MYSIVEAVATTTSTTVAVPPYILKDHITVYRNGLPTTDWSWATEQSVTVVTLPSDVIRVQRRTSPGARLTDYIDGGLLPADVLDVDSLQAFYLAQEAYDQALIGGTVGPIPPGVELTTGELLALLNGQITETQFATSLRDRVELIDAAGSVVGSPAWRVAQEAAARAGADDAVYAAAIAAVGTETTNRVAAVTAEQVARVAGDSALAADITTVIASVDGNTAAIQAEAEARADAIDGVEAKYTIKVQARSDTKQAIAGIGLLATASDTVAQSEIILMADKVQFVPSSAAVDDPPVPIMQVGLVNGVNTLVLPAARVGDGYIASRMVVQGAIETRHLKVAGGSSALNADPGCSDYTAWNNVSSSQVVTVSDGPVGTTAIEIGGSTNIQVTSLKFPVKAGRTYRVSAQMKKTVAGGVEYFRLNFQNAAGAEIAEALPKQDDVGQWEGFVVSSSWTQYRGQVVAPSGAVTASLEIYAGWPATAGTIQVQDWRCEEMIDWSLVVDGGLRADKIDTRNLTIKDAAGNVVFSSGTSPLNDSASSMSFNPTWSAWSGVHPDGWVHWSGNFAVKNTANVINSPYSVQWTVNGATGMVRTHAFPSSAPLPAGSYIEGSFSMYMVANNGGGKPGYLFRLFTDAAQTTYVDTTVEITNSTVGGWQKMSFVAGANGAAIYAIQIYQMAAWGGMPSGALADGSIVLYGPMTFEVRSRITSANVSTYIANVAIGNAQIAELHASKLTAGSITADRIQASAVNANSTGSGGTTVLTVSSGEVTNQSFNVVAPFTQTINGSVMDYGLLGTVRIGLVSSFGAPPAGPYDVYVTVGLNIRRVSDDVLVHAGVVQFYQQSQYCDINDNKYIPISLRHTNAISTGGVPVKLVATVNAQIKYRVNGGGTVWPLISLCHVLNWDGHLTERKV
jgi:hypothetical protein